MNRRDFLSAIAAGAAAGLPLERLLAADADPAGAGADLYRLPKFGNASLLHFTDCHAQLLPIHFREPNVNIGIGDA